MGVFKFLLPKFERHRIFYPVNRDWKRNTALVSFQMFNLAWLIKLSTQHWQFKSVERGLQVVPEDLLKCKPVEFL